MFPPSPTSPPPELHEERDDWRQAVKLINWMRRRVAGLAVGAGPAKLSSDFGDDWIGLFGGLPQTMLWQRPIPYSTFGASISIYMSGVGARSQSGTATISMWVDSNPNAIGDTSITGSVIASTTVTSASYPNTTPITIGPVSIPGPLSGTGYLKISVTPGAGLAQFKEGGVALS